MAMDSDASHLVLAKTRAELDAKLRAKREQEQAIGKKVNPPTVRKPRG